MKIALSRDNRVKQILYLQIWLLFCGISFGQEAMHGTAAVWLYNRDYLVIAADSKMTSGDGNLSRLTCKIGLFEEHNVGYVAAGFIGFPLAQYDLYDIASQACVYPGSFSRKVTFFDSLATVKFVHALANRPTLSDRMAEVGFFTVINDTINLARVTITATDSFDIDHTTENVFARETVTRKGMAADMFGQQEVMLAAMDSIFRKNNTVMIPTAVDLVSHAIKREPRWVGGPIDVLMVDVKRGYRWIAKKEQCN